MPKSSKIPVTNLDDINLLLNISSLTPIAPESDQQTLNPLDNLKDCMDFKCGNYFKSFVAWI